MNKVLYIILISLFSLTIISCSDEEESTTDTTAPVTDTTAPVTDTTAPVIAGVTAVTTPTIDSTPNCTFYSDEAGTITYGGSCSSVTTSATIGNNTITLSSLSVGTYSDCTISVKDSAGNASNTLAIPPFTVAEPEQMGGSIQGGLLSLSTAVTTLAGSSSGYADNATGTSASFNNPYGITTDGTNLYVTDTNNHRIRKIVIENGTVTTIAGQSDNGSTDGTGTSASFYKPYGITTDGTNLYVADFGNHRIRKIVIDNGTVTTLAGSSQGSTDGTGTSASFDGPYDVTTDGTNLYVAESGEHKIRKIVIDNGTVTTLAGTGSQGNEDTAPGISARFYRPQGITTDGTNLYVADYSNHRIRKIVIDNGTVTTLAGSSSGSTDNATGTSASFKKPRGIATDGTNLYVADDNHRIRKIVIDNGTVTTLAGSSSGLNEATGTSALFDRPFGITTDGKNLYVADWDNHRIRKIQ